MDEYFLFQKIFDPFIYINDRKQINKENLIKHGGQIPSFFRENYILEELIDHGFLNLLKKNEKLEDLKIYLYEQDYLQLFLFLRFQVSFTKMSKYGKEKILRFFINNLLEEYIYFFLDFDNLIALHLYLENGLVITKNHYLYACRFSGLKIINFLFNNGYLINVDCIENSLENKNIEVFKFLINKGIIVTPRCVNIILRSSRFDTVKMLEFLIENNTNLTDGNNLVFACRYCNFEVIKILLDNGADVNYNNSLCLFTACENLNFNVLKLLIEKGANINNGIFIFACKQGLTKLVKFLIEKNCIVTNDALIHSNTNYDIIKILIGKGLDVNYSDGECLIQAVEFCNYDTIDLLLKNGANLNVRNGEAMKIAKNMGNNFLIELLSKFE